VILEHRGGDWNGNGGWYVIKAFLAFWGSDDYFL
jgi:hypothetical protein